MIDENDQQTGYESWCEAYLLLAPDPFPLTQFPNKCFIPPLLQQFAKGYYHFFLIKFCSLGEMMCTECTVVFSE